MLMMLCDIHISSLLPGNEFIGTFYLLIFLLEVLTADQTYNGFTYSSYFSIKMQNAGLYFFLLFTSDLNFLGINKLN